MSPDLCIVSGSTQLRLPSPVNHRVYADLHQADYRLEGGPTGKLGSRYYFKLDVLVRLLPRYNWVMWIDDDAFFTDFSSDIRGLLHGLEPTTLLAVADGRVRPTGQWTRINSGVILARNCEATLTFLKLCLTTDLASVKAWWREEEHGMWTNSDQDTLLYRILQHAEPYQITILPHLQLNAREYHYGSRVDEHFICHFPGVPDKVAALRTFGRRFGVGPDLVPPDLLKSQGYDDGIGEWFLPLPREDHGRLRHVRRWLRRVLRA